VRVQVPPHLLAAAGGKREYVKTLKTGDLNEANRLKHAYVAAFKRQIAALGHHKPNPLAELYDKALAWRDAMERHKGEVLFYEGDDREKPYYATDEFLGQISDEAGEFLETHGEKAATSFYKIAKGEGTPVRNLIDTWLAEEAGTITAQTSAQHKTVLNVFLAWAGEGVLIEDVHRRRAGEFVSHLLAPASKLSRKTAQRYVSSLSSLWARLEARGVAQGNPWRGQGVGKKSKRGEMPKRKQWSDDALIKVLGGTYTPRYTVTLRDLVRLALVTGARLDELCALKTGDVQKREDGWWVTIREGKTEAAVREVPIHDSAAHVLIRRCKNSDGFVFDGLIPGGPDNKRSWNVSKAFGRYTRTLGLGEERQVFHALRNTFTEAMEAAEVPESTTKLIIGHARKSLTYGHYSKGERVKLRKHINKLHYASGAIRLIRAAGGDKQTQRARLPTKQPPT
jgi:integrase